MRIKSIYFLVVILLSALFSCKVKESKKTFPIPAIWSFVNPSVLTVNKDSLPKKFSTVKLNLEGLRMEMKKASKEQQLTISYPMPDSSFEAYSIVEVSVMSEALAARYPYIKTYAGSALANGANHVRAEFDEYSFHAYFTTNKGELFISPVGKKKSDYYLIYYKSDSPFLKEQFEQRK